MKYYAIAGLSRNVSQLVLGSALFGDLKRPECWGLLDAWIGLGGNMVDTGRIYGGGESEKIIGDWLAASGARSKMMVLTKGCHYDATRDRVSKRDLDEDLRASLEALRVDYVDLYLLHRDDPSVPVGEIVDWLHEHRQAGRIHAFGGSNWSPARVDAANEYARRRDIPGFAAVSNYVGLALANEPIWRGCEMMGREHVEWHMRTGIPNFCWSSLARGFFTGRFRPDDRSDPDFVRTFYNATNWERLRRAEELANQRGLSATQVACAYVLNQPFPSVALVGPVNVTELQANVAAAGISLTPAEMARLEVRLS